MARIAGVNLPKQKRVEIGLTYIHGVGRTLSNKILDEAKISPDKKVSDLTSNEVSNLSSILRKYPIEGELKRIVITNIRRKQEIGSYQGMRHSRKLPVRGQRTKTNARTKRGKKVTMGSGKRKEMKK